MAQDAQKDEDIKWKLGAKCSLFDRANRKWNHGTIVGSFSDKKGEWIKVQCSSGMHDVLTDDPDLRVVDQQDAVITTQKINELQAVARRRPEIASMVEQAITISNEIRSTLQNTSKS